MVKTEDKSWNFFKWLSLSNALLDRPLAEKIMHIFCQNPCWNVMKIYEQNTKNPHGEQYQALMRKTNLVTEP